MNAHCSEFLKGRDGQELLVARNGCIHAHSTKQIWIEMNNKIWCDSPRVSADRRSLSEDPLNCRSSNTRNKQKVLMVSGDCLCMGRAKKGG